MPGTVCQCLLARTAGPEFSLWPGPATHPVSRVPGKTLQVPQTSLLGDFFVTQLQLLPVNIENVTCIPC